MEISLRPAWQAAVIYTFYIIYYSTSVFLSLIKIVVVVVVVVVSTNVLHQWCMYALMLPDDNGGWPAGCWQDVVGYEHGKALSIQTLQHHWHGHTD